MRRLWRTGRLPSRISGREWNRLQGDQRFVDKRKKSEFVESKRQKHCIDGLLVNRVTGKLRHKGELHVSELGDGLLRTIRDALAEKFKIVPKKRVRDKDKDKRYCYKYQCSGQ